MARYMNDFEEPKKKGFSIFWVFYLLLIIAAVVFWIVIINKVKGYLVEYEACQPSHTVETLVTQIQSGDISMMDFVASGSRFEDGNIYKDNYAASISGKLITFKENPSSYDTENPEYDIFANDVKVATAKLHQTSSEQMMFILSKQTWEVSEVKPIYEVGAAGATVFAPENCSVYINGIAVSEAEKMGEAKVYSGFTYVEDYVTIPREVSYSVSGLMTAPTVNVYAPSGEELNLSVEGNVYTADVHDLYVTSTIPEDLYTKVLTNAKNWSDFFSTDLPGSQSSTKCIEGMFPAGSDYVTLAENYRLHDMWMYSAHATPSFANEKLENFIQYSDTFFSVEVYFEKTMYLTRTGETRTDITHATHYYVNIDGTWYIADMIDILD